MTTVKITDIQEEIWKLEAEAAQLRAALEGLDILPEDVRKAASKAIQDKLDAVEDRIITLKLAAPRAKVLQAVQDLISQGALELPDGVDTLTITVKIFRDGDALRADLPVKTERARTAVTQGKGYWAASKVELHPRQSSKRAQDVLDWLREHHPQLVQNGDIVVGAPDDVWDAIRAYCTEKGLKTFSPANSFRGLGFDWVYH